MKSFFKPVFGAVTLFYAVVGASSAQAVIMESARYSVTTDINANEGFSIFTYTITNTGTHTLLSFEIPQFRLGDLTPLLGDGTEFLNTTSFNFSETSAPNLFDAGGGLYRGTPGGYIYLSGGELTPGDSYIFSLGTTRTGSTNAMFAFFDSSEMRSIVDPLIPGTLGVPEPASWALMIAGFGLTGAAMRRRVKVQALPT